MKKLNFIIMLLTMIISIDAYMYVDVIRELIPKTVGLSVVGEEVTHYDLLLNAFYITIVSFFPLLLLSYLYQKLKFSLAWSCSIWLIYTLVWFYIGYLIMHGYIQHYGHTWLDIEVFFYLLGLKDIYVVYLLGLIPLVGLGIVNYRKNKWL